jgi:hypothetical protein
MAEVWGSGREFGRAEESKQVKAVVRVELRANRSQDEVGLMRCYAERPTFACHARDFEET